LTGSRAAALASIDRGEAEEGIAEAQKKFEGRLKTWERKSEGILGPLITEARTVVREESMEARVDDVYSPSEAEIADFILDDNDATDSLLNGGDQGLMHEDVRLKLKSMDSKGKTRLQPWEGIHNAEIVLPSTCAPQVRSTKCMEDAVSIEIRLRKAQADNALDTLRTHLITSYAFKQEVKKTAVKHDMVTRNQKAIKAKNARIVDSANEYRRAYAALIALGFHDPINYRPLAATDVRAFELMSADEQLGKSKRTPSWIWMTLSFLDTKDVESDFDKYAEAGKWLRPYHDRSSMEM
jgi:hypothetical protein